MTARSKKSARRRQTPVEIVEIVVTYRGPHDWAKDRRIYAALSTRTGSGYSFAGGPYDDGTRDIGANVDPGKWDATIARLKKIRGITIKKLVKKWVRVR